MTQPTKRHWAGNTVPAYSDVSQQVSICLPSWNQPYLGFPLERGPTLDTDTWGIHHIQSSLQVSANNGMYILLVYFTLHFQCFRNIVLKYSDIEFAVYVQEGNRVQIAKLCMRFALIASLMHWGAKSMVHTYLYIFAISSTSSIALHKVWKRTPVNMD